MAAEVTIIIPNYNGKKMLKNCIKSLEKQTCRNFLLLVVDNGSTDGSSQVTSDILDMEMLCLSENTGFCGAVNRGLSKTKTPYAILLNNDTEALPHFVEALLDAIRGQKDIFSCSAQMIDAKNKKIIDNAGDLYTVFGWAVSRGKGRNTAEYEKRSAIFSSCGGAAIFQMDAIRKIGMLDEKHFAYLEDVDLGYRAKIHGYRSLYEPKAKVYHIGSATTGTRYNEKKVFLAARNSVYVVYKNMPFLQLFCNLPFLLLGILIKMAFFAGKGFGSEYAKGIGTGIAGAAKCKKVPFQICNLKHYIWIEGELFVNILRILTNK